METPTAKLGTSGSTLNVSEIIDNSEIRALHVVIFLLCTLCMIIDGFDTQALGFVAPAIIQDWKISPALLGPVFGASNFGVLIGQLTFTVLADKIGRRPVLIGGTVFFAVMTILTGRATSISELLVIRFIAGLGLGSVVPNATALIGEYSPRARRVAMMTWLGIGFTAGAALGGFVAAWMIPRYGWPSVFYIGGASPLVLAAVMSVYLPESLKLLALRGREADRRYIARWLTRVDPRVAVSGDTVFMVPEVAKRGVPVRHLFGEGRARFTLLLWVINFMNLLELYSLANWLPTVVRGAGYSTSTAVLVGTTLQVGGTLSPFLLAWLITKKGFAPVLTVTFAIATLAVATMGQPWLSLGMLLVTVFIAGACVPGAQPALNTLSGTFYPTSLRSTGLGWGLGIGRVGSIVGPVIAGWFIAAHWPTQAIFLTLAVPALIATTAVVMLRSTIDAHRP